MDPILPPSVLEFRRRHPEVWQAFATLGEKCHVEGGPLDERSRRLAKLGIAIGLRHEGAVHSAVRQALSAGITVEEVHHVAILAITSAGWPASYAAMTWIDDVAGAGETGPPPGLE